MRSAIRTEDLTKDYAIGFWRKRPSRALDRLTLDIAPAEVFGFLGPNGAGKTTTMKIVLGLMRPTSGSVQLLGRPIQDVHIHKKIGYLPESPYFYDYLTAEEFLGFYGRLGGVSQTDLHQRIPALLERVGLTEARCRPLRKFSKGMLQRIGLAQALIHDPELVILDEPMSGLDPIGRKDVRDIILSLRDQGKTVFFSTHIISDVEMICDRVGILAKGRMLAVGRIEDLVSRHATQSVEVVCEGVLADSIPLIKDGAIRVLQRGSRCWMSLPGQQKLEDVLSAIRQAGGRLVSVIPHKGTLEELFLEQTNQGV